MMMTKRDGVPVCEPAGESWWCRLKERIDYLWDRASACILTINHQTPDGDGDFAITGGGGITVTDEDNGIRISATLTEETVEGIVGQEAAARQTADQALQSAIDAEEQARISADQTLQADITTLESEVDGKADKAQLDEYVLKDQGIENAGKALIIGSDGVVAPGNAGGGGGDTIWGEITGNIVNQTDLQTQLDGTVKTTGNQTISGTKVINANGYLQLQASELGYKDVTVYGSDSYRLGHFRAYDMEGEHRTDLSVFRPESNTMHSLRLIAGSDGSVTTSCPSPASDADGLEIATARWVNDKIEAKITETQTSIEALTYHGSDADKSVLRLDNVTAGDLISLSISTAYTIPMIAVPALNTGGSYALPNTGTIDGTIWLKRDDTGYYLDAATYIYNQELAGTRIRLGNTSSEVTQ